VDLLYPTVFTLTTLPIWSPPYGHYSFRCRQQAWESCCQNGGGWEQSAPHSKDPTRLPDPSTLRRWACRRVVSLWHGVKALWLWPLEWHKILQAPSTFGYWTTYKHRIGNPPDASPAGG
jgi:hypothetical protein